MREIQIIPSLLAQTQTEFITSLCEVQRLVTMIQIDIADGIFVSNTTWADPDIISKYLEIDVELHLMVKDPLEELKKWEHVQQVKRVLLHIETMQDDAENILMQIENLYDWQISIVLNPDTEIVKIEPILNHVFGVMFMGVIPGFQGQPFDQKVLKKISEFRQRETGHFIAIDGGVNEKTLPAILASGVDAVCPGSAIFKNKTSIKKSLEEMQKQIKEMSD